MIFYVIYFFIFYLHLNSKPSPCLSFPCLSHSFSDSIFLSSVLSYHYFVCLSRCLPVCLSILGSGFSFSLSCCQVGLSTIWFLSASQFSALEINLKKKKSMWSLGCKLWQYLQLKQVRNIPLCKMQNANGPKRSL